jgi:hypothetical protein
MIHPLFNIQLLSVVTIKLKNNGLTALLRFFLSGLKKTKSFCKTNTSPPEDG